MSDAILYNSMKVGQLILGCTIIVVTSKVKRQTRTRNVADTLKLDYFTN